MDSEEIIFGQKILDSLPKPISEIGYQIENEQNPQIGLQLFCFSLIPMTFQYFALVLSSEYLEHESSPNINVSESIWAMFRRPGPGKWLQFIRQATIYLKENSPSVISAEAINEIDALLVTKKRPRIKTSEGSSNSGPLDYFEALVNIRNRFAHSRFIENDRASILLKEHYHIWKLAVRSVPKLFETKVLISNEGNEEYISLDNRPFDNTSICRKTTRETMILWNETGKNFLKLFPLIVPIHETDSVNNDAMFLEEVKGRNLLYIYRQNVYRRKNEYAQLIQTLDKRTPKTETISSEDLTASILGERIDILTNRTLTDFEDSLKYVPSMFIERESITSKLDKWLEATPPGCIMVGDPGVGKTSLVAHWCSQRRSKGDHVLLIEASKLEDSDLPLVISAKLNLSSTLKDSFDSVFRQINQERLGSRFIIIIDAVNEFVGSGFSNRTVLLREINSLLDRISDYQPHFKCLVTTRADTWKKDFPTKEGLEQTIKRRLCWGNDGQEFPLFHIKNLNNQEAEEIYEKARQRTPGMSPKTPYNELPDSTKKLITNPFLLRLILQTYNDTNVPTVTERKIHRHFIKEKIQKEKEQKKILFTLLERISELRKTEVTIDELISTQKTKSGKKKSKKQKTSIKNIIFDPRPTSPYKQLLENGIIEERTIRNKEQIEERISFSQEKITGIMYREFLINRIRLTLFAALKWLPIITLLSLGLLLYSNYVIGFHKENIELLLKNSLLNETERMVLLNSGSLIIQENISSYILHLIYIIFGWYIILILFNCIGKYIWLHISKSKNNDLPDRFAKEIIQDYKQKFLKFFATPAIAYIIIVVIYLISNLQRFGTVYKFVNVLTFQLMITAALLIFGDFLSELWAIIKSAKTPVMARVRLGWDSVKESLIQQAAIIPILLVIFIFLIPFTFDILIDKNNQHALRLSNELTGSPEYTGLQEVAETNEDDRKILHTIDINLYKIDDREKAGKAIQKIYKELLKVILGSIAILFIILQLLSLLLVKPVERYLTKKLYPE